MITVRRNILHWPVEWRENRRWDNEIRWWWRRVCVWRHNSHIYNNPNKVNGIIIKIKKIQLWPFDDYQWAKRVDSDFTLTLRVYVSVSGSFVDRMIETAATPSTLYYTAFQSDRFFSPSAHLPTCWLMFLQRCYYVVFHRLVNFNVRIKYRRRRLHFFSSSLFFLLFHYYTRMYTSTLIELVSGCWFNELKKKKEYAHRKSFGKKRRENAQAHPI